MIEDCETATRRNLKQLSGDSGVGEVTYCLVEGGERSGGGSRGL